MLFYNYHYVLLNFFFFYNILVICQIVILKFANEKNIYFKSLLLLNYFFKLSLNYYLASFFINIYINNIL